MASTTGRRVEVPLTNKSGGQVIAGDVVILDSANDDAFTTTTSAGYTGALGIAQETIANNATGKVLLSGEAALVNVNASVTRGHFGSTHTVAKQAADAGAARVVGTFCQFKTGGTTPKAVLFGFPDASSATGNVATDAIWDAAGDLAVGTGANTAARLAVGAAGGALSSLNGTAAYNSGTSFPANKATGDRYWRTDLGLEFYWDGTRWLSSQLLSLELPYDDDGSSIDTPSTGYAATREIGWATIPWAGTYDIYVTELRATSFVPANNDGTKFWTVALYKRTPAQAATSLGSFATSADTAAVATAHSVAINAVVSSVSSAFTYLSLGVTKTSTPNNLYVSAVVFYRIIAT